MSREEILLLEVEPSPPGRLVRAVLVRFGGFRKREIEIQMALADSVLLTGRLELLVRVLPNRLQQAISPGVELDGN
jgi:hypothetical protein